MGEPADARTRASRHRRGGLVIENRANFAAQAEDYREAVQFYAAARTETRRAAMIRPRRPLTQELLDLTRSRLERADYARACQEVERLSMADIVRPDGEV